ncbi:hypothetical protein AVEN_211818-1 [Araneus ventricosus]|uniref:Uncharacterized protein n=1 Tax=Araneus ventricosus TaxID=182803 RepID=A0A4Y2N4H1_ARAVE|nr:hypothetical protein AVEN_211818-1 [Araneus ventricosus]
MVWAAISFNGQVGLAFLDDRQNSPKYIEALENDIMPFAENIGGTVRQQVTVRSGGASVMVWDMYSWRDMVPLIRLETTKTGDRYLSILSDHLHLFMSIVQSDGLGRFQQDNATTPHVSRVATK